MLLKIGDPFRCIVSLSFPFKPPKGRPYFEKRPKGVLILHSVQRQKIAPSRIRCSKHHGAIIGKNRRVDCVGVAPEDFHLAACHGIFFSTPLTQTTRHGLVVNPRSFCGFPLKC